MLGVGFREFCKLGEAESGRDNICAWVKVGFEGVSSLGVLGDGGRIFWKRDNSSDDKEVGRRVRGKYG